MAKRTKNLGRPTKAQRFRRTVRTTVSFSKTEHRKVVKTARQRGMSLRELILEACK